MPPTLILIRHGQAVHNLTQDPSLQDPQLTELGYQQCEQLQENLHIVLPAELRDHIDLIITSPMRRTIETSLLSLDWLLKAGVPIQANALWQETTEFPCDTGSPLPTLKTQYPGIDFSHVDPVYPDKTSPQASLYRHTKHALLLRAQTALAKLYSRSEKVIVVVSHSGFLRRCVTGNWFENADYRVFDFEERGKSDEEPYRLRQWDFTKSAGGRGLSWKGVIDIGEGLHDEETS